MKPLKKLEDFTFEDVLELLKEVLEDKPSAVKRANELLTLHGITGEPELPWLGDKSNANTPSQLH